MIKFLFLGVIIILFTGCVNRHGVSLKYYSDCEEYYDLQGYYHKDCGKDDVITYKEMQDHAMRVKAIILKERPLPKGNVY